ncbi:hypothetical protein [Paraliobacillus sp. X-1268]|uniref:hypothetical protein n=1 Tax=Paraliobacillus sp. X-1268 TaxID=2213193 RepID=UPI000E3D18B4|nr:hypothetical protein [Paraliobacillus sp. X-1268]
MSQYYLKSDPLTDGVITRILEDCWKGNLSIRLEDLKMIHDVLLNHDVFGEVAENIYVPSHNENVVEPKDKLLEGLTSRVKQHKEHKNKMANIKLFQNQGLILKDDIYGSAFGRFNYIYRAKGTRIFWFSNGLIKYTSAYSTIDENGFNYSVEEVDECNIFMDIDISEITGTPLDEAFGNGEVLISNLVNIKADFIRDYALEYLLYPPDVMRLSNFSIQLDEQIWDAIIDMIKEVAIEYNKEKVDLLSYLTEFTVNQGISPDANHVMMLFDFYRENHLIIDSRRFHDLMYSIRKTSEPQENLHQHLSASVLISKLEKTEVGPSMANEYHDLIFDCLSQIFNDNLKGGKKEVKIDQGMKRIDIVFDNFDKEGFFAHIRDRFDVYCPKIFIECKNYSSDPVNPEVDQLIGRLSDTSGKFGILVCRNVENEEKLMQRCRAALYKRQGHIIYLVDDDIKNLLRLKETGDDEGIINYLSEKWDSLILNN